MPRTRRDSRRTGLWPLAYMGAEPIAPPLLFTDNRAPTPEDRRNFNVGTIWINRATAPNEEVWVLVNLDGQIARWIRFTGAATGILTLTGNVGGPVGADALLNIDVVGGGPYIITGNPGANSLTLNDDGTVPIIHRTDVGDGIAAANIIRIVGGPNVNTGAVGDTITINLDGTIAHTYTTDAGNAAPAAGVLNVFGGELIGTTGAGNTVTANLDRGTDGQIPIAATGAPTVYANLASAGGTIAITNGANTINLETGGAIATQYNTDAGNAVAAAGILNVFGGASLGTTGGGNTVTVALDDPGDGVVHSVGGVLAGDRGTDGQVIIGQTAGAEAWANIASADGTVVITNGPNSIDLSAAAAAVNTIFTRFTVNGVWNKNANTKYIEVYTWDSGGSGASGRRGASTAAGGGAGGSCGQINWAYGPSFMFPANAAVTIGAATAGGAAILADNTNGNPGTLPNVTIFGALIDGRYPGAPVPGASNGGINGAAAAGLAGIQGIMPRQGGVIQTCIIGGNGSLANGANARNFGSKTGATPSLNLYLTAGAGGGGAGADAVAERTGGDGTSLYTVGGNLATQGGVGGVESGAIDGTNGANNITFDSICIVGGLGGGGGGGQSVGGAAGNGGDGGTPGGCGGGGGGSLNGTNSGAGGAGARGEVIVIEYL